MTTVIFKEPNSIPMIIMSDTMKDKETLNLIRFMYALPVKCAGAFYKALG